MMNEECLIKGGGSQQSLLCRRIMFSIFRTDYLVWCCRRMGFIMFRIPLSLVECCRRNGAWVFVCSGCSLYLVGCCSCRMMGFSMFRMHPLSCWVLCPYLGMLHREWDFGV
jgi:hypothetical protein